MADLVVGDYGITIEVSLTRGGAAYSLEGATVALLFFRPDGTTIEKTPTIPDPESDGKVQYAIEEEFLNMAGVWEGDVQVVKSGIHTTGKFKFRVRKE